MSAAPTVLAVGGSDPTAGAGIFADLRTLEAFGVQSSAVVTAITVQNASRVLDVQPVSPKLIHDQMCAVLDSIEVNAVKVGMLPTAAAVRTVARLLDAYEVKIVVDPVMKPSGGKRLAAAGVRESLIEELLPLADCVTANLAEAAALTGKPVRDIPAMKWAARALVDLGSDVAIVKGGHLRGRADDVIWDGRRMTRLCGSRLQVGPMHGSGCAFAAATAALLSGGADPLEAATDAKRYVRDLLKTAVDAGDGARLRTPSRRSVR